MPPLAVIAVLVGIAAAARYANIELGAVIAIAIILNLIVAAISGILIPLLLDRVGADPAISSSIFVTMTTDLTGFVGFLGLATWWFGLG